MQMENMYVKRCSTLYVTQDMKIVIMRHYYKSVRMVQNWNTDNTNANQAVELIAIGMYLTGKEAKMVQATLGEHLALS